MRCTEMAGYAIRASLGAMKGPAAAAQHLGSLLVCISVLCSIQSDTDTRGNMILENPLILFLIAANRNAPSVPHGMYSPHESSGTHNHNDNRNLTVSLKEYCTKHASCTTHQNIPLTSSAPPEALPSGCA